MATAELREAIVIGVGGMLGTLGIGGELGCMGPSSLAALGCMQSHCDAG
jgi:hypothetical protein